MNDTIFFAGYFVGLAVLMSVSALLIVSPTAYSRIILRFDSPYPSNAEIWRRKFLRVNRGHGIALFLGAAFMFFGPVIQSISQNALAGTSNGTHSGLFRNDALVAVLFSIQICFGVFLWMLPRIVAQDMGSGLPSPDAIGKARTAQVFLTVRILGAALSVSGLVFLLCSSRGHG
jgi:hypothetical protein